MRTYRWLLLAALLLVSPALAAAGAVDVNSIAEDYVKLVLEVGLYDADYVDAYYGPPDWKPSPFDAEDPFPASRLRTQADTLIAQLAKIGRDPFDGIEKLRYDFLDKQLRSVRGRIDLLAGVKMSFDKESEILYDAVVPPWHEKHYQDILDELDKRLPGEGDLYQRFNEYRIKFTIPRNKIQEALQASIATYRQRTRRHIALPDHEEFEMEFVSGKPWGAWATYQGDGLTRIQVNADAPFCVADIVHLARHEIYPGHHTHLTLLDTHLVEGKGWMEFSVLPLYSPLVLVAEGLAEYGSYDLLPRADRLAFERSALFPLAGVAPPETETYDKIMQLKSTLDGAVAEAARRYLAGQMDHAQTQDWLRRYALMLPGAETSMIKFIDQHRSYVITYALGRRLVKDYINRRGGATDPAKRWKLFQTLLSTPQTPSNLARQ